MYEVRSKVQGALVFSRIGKAFGRFGQREAMEESDLQDTEVKRALKDGRLEVLSEKRVGAPEGEGKDVLLSKKDWEQFREVMMECTEHVTREIKEAIQEEGEKIRESLGEITLTGGSPDSRRPTSSQKRARKITEELDYVITPTFTSQEARMDTSKSQESGDDLNAGILALKKMREADDSNG